MLELPQLVCKCYANQALLWVFDALRLDIILYYSTPKLTVPLSILGTVLVSDLTQDFPCMIIPLQYLKVIHLQRGLGGHFGSMVLFLISFQRTRSLIDY